MFKIVAKEKLCPVVDFIKIEAPELAKKAKPGQFVIIRMDEVGERIPLTLADWHEKEGTISLVVMKVGTSTYKLSAINPGDYILNVAGPLGLPSHIEKFGTVVCVGGGVGVAPIFPIARALKQADNKVISIMGARNKDLLFWEDRLRSVSDELIVTTDDGSYAHKGIVTEPLKEILEKDKQVKQVIAIGPAIMMKFCSLATKPFGIKTIVSLNSIMVDGTGMCGCCRVSVGGTTKFACVDGPEFDGHQLTGNSYQIASGVIVMKRNTLLNYGIRVIAKKFELEDSEWKKKEKTKQKLNLNRVSMPHQDPMVRAKNYEEVALGYTQEMALNEADRCIQCPKRPCVEGCPVNVDIPDFIKAIRDKNMPEAVKILKGKNSLPGVCGRVCPQEVQCEKKCTLSKKGAPIAIGRLERYVADWELNNKPGNNPQPNLPPPTGKKVAVIGSGPAGLTCAADLAKRGHKVTIFEALHIAGGVLMYGIPEFRLPKRVVQTEVEFVKSLGADIKLDSVMGKLATVDELLQDDYDAIFLGTGAGLPMFLNIPGENLNGIYSANEFLTRVNLMKAYLFPQYDTPIKIGKRVAVIGGGNVAMDAARCALRLGADKVYIIYRRSRAEMPARHEEVENAEEEGIIFKLLTNPKQFIGNDQGWIIAMTCDEMELGEPDASGRRRPIVKKGSEFVMDIDVAIVALGTTPNPLIPATTIGLKTRENGTVIADEQAGKTMKDKVWAGGDVITGSATVISAMGAGKRAAASIDAYLKG